VVKSELATFLEVFPHSTVWSNDQFGEGYDTVVLGTVEPTQIDVDELMLRLEDEDHALVGQSLYEVGFNNVFDVLATYAGDANSMQEWLADAEINRDRNLRLQYLAGLGASQSLERKIHRDMIKQRKYPEQLFRTTQESRAALLVAMGLVDLEP
jgi:spermidine synthase